MHALGADASWLKDALWSFVPSYSFSKHIFLFYFGFHPVPLSVLLLRGHLSW